MQATVLTAPNSSTRSVQDRTVEVLRRVGNPFRNYFARNPDDEVCARYHVPELFAKERDILLQLVDLYRAEPATHSEVVPVLGNKGSGKTHLLHSIKHGMEGAWQMLVTPGSYQKDTDFLEYLLFQLIDTLLGGGKQKGARPLEFIGEEVVRRLLHATLANLAPQDRLELFPTPGLGRWARRLGLGSSQAQERTQWLLDTLAKPCSLPFTAGTIRKACEEAGLQMQQAFTLVCAHIEKTEGHSTAGLMRRHISQGFVRSVLLGDDSALANFVTFGFAELDFKVEPSRQDLVLALFKVIMAVFHDMRIPVVVAFDQLEDLLLARRNEDCHRVAEAFFAGIVKTMHQIDGICFLIFAERGLWNRFVPSLDGYIQDRLNNPVHLPGYGTLQALRLEAPSTDLVESVVQARLRPALNDVPDASDLPAFYPFQRDQLQRIARTEPTLRDMLQQFRHVFDHVVYGEAHHGAAQEPTTKPRPELQSAHAHQHVGNEAITIKSVVVVESSSTTGSRVETPVSNASPTVVPIVHPAMPASLPARAASPAALQSLNELWEQETRSAKRKLEPDGALTGATRELQSGLGAFLQICHEHGVKVGPWRLQHVVPEWTFGEHPTYGAVTIAHWVCKDGQPWKVGIGLFLGRGVAKPRDLGTKLASLEAEPPVIDHLILLRPEDDLTLTGKSKAVWQEAEKRGRHPRLEAVSLDSFSILYAFPRWLAAVTESLPSGQPLPNLAELLQEKCERLLEQVCMPVQGG